MVIIESLLTSNDLESVRSQLAQASWESGKKTAMGMAASVKENTQANRDDPIVEQLSNALLSRFGQNSTFVSAALPHKIFPPCFSRYVESEHYGFHVDAAIMRFPKSNQVLRSDLSMTLFLNEPDEYEGGELQIQTEFGEQRVKLNAGSAVLYPSSSLHKVTPVTQGTRLVAITWIQSMVSNESTRTTLFNLDQTLQGLAQEGKASREHLDSLHNVYHNLVRQQAEIG